MIVFYYQQRSDKGPSNWNAYWRSRYAFCYYSCILPKSTSLISKIFLDSNQALDPSFFEDNKRASLKILQRLSKNYARPTIITMKIYIANDDAVLPWILKSIYNIYFHGSKAVTYCITHYVDCFRTVKIYIANKQ